MVKTTGVILPIMMALWTASIAQPACAGDNLSLNRKAKLFELELERRFMQNGQVMTEYRLPNEDRIKVTFGTAYTAYLTGLNLAAQTWEWKATGDNDAKLRAREAWRSLQHLMTVTGHAGLMARSSIPFNQYFYDEGVWTLDPTRQYRWRAEAGSTQVTGALFGCFVYYELLATEEEKAAIGKRVGDVVKAILLSDRKIVDYNASIPEQSDYQRGHVFGERIVNGLLLLQHVKIADHMTDDTYFAKVYEELLAEGYLEAAENARKPLPPKDVNHADDMLIALALQSLMELEIDWEFRRKIQEGARRWFEGHDGQPGVSVEQNPFFNFLWETWNAQKEFRQAGIESLRHVPLDMKLNPDTITEYQRSMKFQYSPDPRAVERREGEVVPIDHRPKTWNFLAQSPYDAVADRSAPSMSEYPGVDYLLAYWYGRAHDLIGEDE